MANCDTNQSNHPSISPPTAQSTIRQSAVNLTTNHTIH